MVAQRPILDHSERHRMFLSNLIKSHIQLAPSTFIIIAESYQ